MPPVSAASSLWLWCLCLWPCCWVCSAPQLKENPVRVVNNPSASLNATGSGGMTAPPWHEEGPMPTISDSLFSLIILIYVGVIFVFMFFSFCWKEPTAPPAPSTGSKDIPMITEMILEQEKKEAEEAAAAKAQQAAHHHQLQAQEDSGEGAAQGDEDEDAAAVVVGQVLGSAEKEPQAVIIPHLAAGVMAGEHRDNQEHNKDSTEMKEMLLLDSLPPIQGKTELTAATASASASEKPKKTDVSTQVEGKTVATQV